MTKNRKIKNIADGITQVNKLYLQNGFNIKHMHSGSEFGKIRREMNTLGINLNCASKKGHASEIERFIRTVKEHVRSSRYNILLKQLFNIIIVHLV